MYLGEITVPQNNPDWVSLVTYRAEPPIVVRGSLDPWGQERKREQWLAEEKAWKEIVPLQTRWRALSTEFQRIMGRYNGLLAELESLTGASGLVRVKGPLSMVVSPLNMVFSLLDTLTFGIFGGAKKKKRVDEMVRELEMLQARMMQIQTQLAGIAETMTRLVHMGRAVKEAQQVRTAQDLQKSGEMYIQSQAAQRMEATQHRERALLYERLYPARQGGSDAL